MVLCPLLLVLCPCLWALTVLRLSILAASEANTKGYSLKGFLVDLNAQVARAGGGSSCAAAALSLRLVGAP